IAKGNVFLPSAASVAKLIEQLRAERWIVDPGSSDLAKLHFAGSRAELAKATGGYAVKTVENTFGDDVAKKIAASTEAQPAQPSAEWLDDPDREELRLVWPVRADELPVKYPLSHVPEGPISYALELHRAPEYVYPVADTIGAIESACACGEELDFAWDEDEV